MMGLKPCTFTGSKGEVPWGAVAESARRFLRSPAEKGSGLNPRSVNLIFPKPYRVKDASRFSGDNRF